MTDTLVSVAQKKLIDVVEQELSPFAGVTRELRNLSSTFETIKAVLDDADSKQASDNNVKLWLSSIRHVAYDIEDLLDDGRISGLGDEEGNEDDGNCINKLCLCFSLPYNPWDYAVSRYRMARDIKEIRLRLDQIEVEGNRFGFSRSTQGGDDRRPVGSQSLTTSLMDETEMFLGRELDKELMISRLVSGSSHEDEGQAHVVAIFGIGGLGKTTLARQIYHDGRVQGHFNGDLYWVCASEVFDVIGLTKAILEQVKRTVNFPSEPDKLQKELLEALRGKRFLLVLDDVWNDDAKMWNTLKLPLNSGAHGSRILVTTHGQKVAKTMNATYIHKLQGLSYDDSWEVFSSRAFAGMTTEECSKLENVGRQIVSKCRGVPLAITVMGSAMNSKRTIADWQNILDSKTWSLRDAENENLPALWLSYYNLPRQLKQCFAYCSMFPKDWVLEKDMLVRLWAAQGLIRSDGNRDVEDIGAGYFDDLVAWSMFQEVKKNSGGKITCKMHDLLHDLAESITKDEIYDFIGKSEQCPIASSNVRHSFLFFTGSTDDRFDKIPIALGRATKLRTLFLHRLPRIDKFIVDIFRQARFVRALVFSGFSSRMVKSPDAIVELPKAIGDLKHLRYLDLSGLDILELPESVSHLCNLHRLNLTDCGKLKKLPRGIGGMVRLRHLEIEGTDSLKYLPKGLGRISGLRSLCKFIVEGGDEGEGCGIDELQPLNFLQGTLCLEHLERVSSREEAEKARLWNKQHLGSLVLRMSAGRHDDAETERIDNVLEGLRPHENLEELYLDGFSGSKLPSWMTVMPCLRTLYLTYGPQLERVPHLPSLKKFDIWESRNEILPDEGWEQLVALQDLRICFCKELKCLPEGLTQLPSLEKLDIQGCDNLESLPEGLGQLKKLKSLAVGGSEVLRCVPDSLGQLKSLENLDIRSFKKLESVPPSLGQLRKLETLVIHNLNALRCVPDSVGQLESLESLRISSCEKLESLPVSLGQLKELKSLEISSLEALRYLPDSIGQLGSLQELYIRSCKELESLPVSLGQLESLKRLRFYDLKKLVSFPQSLVLLKKLESLSVGGLEVLTCVPDWVGQLESLEKLCIYDLRKLESLPNSLGQLMKLKVLEVDGLEWLRCLPDWVGQLESLQELYISSCKKLESLPDSLGEKALSRLDIRDCEALASLPQGLRHVSSLFIRNCPLLWERYKREGGVDWPNISHIPAIRVNGEWIQ